MKLLGPPGSPYGRKVRVVLAAKNIPYCYGTTFTLADIAAGFALGYLEQVLPDVDWRRDFPKLEQLAARLAARESFVTSKPAA